MDVIDQEIACFDGTLAFNQVIRMIDAGPCSELLECRSHIHNLQVTNQPFYTN